MTWPCSQSEIENKPRISTLTAALIGSLIAAAAVQREAGLFAIPVVIVYLAWVRVGWRPFVVILVSWCL